MLRDPLDRIGRYRLDRRLGAGGFGVVWLAHDEVLEAVVALKVLSDNWADHLDVRERFLSEARLLRKADSNRVVQVYDIGELPDGRPYFVMEYADGGTLADRIETGPLPIAEALRLTALAARARPRCTRPESCTATSSRPTYCCAPRPAAPTASYSPTSGSPRAWRRPPG
ncbi:protein kinase [Streptomyces sp. RLB1-33]